MVSDVYLLGGAAVGSGGRPCGVCCEWMEGGFLIRRLYPTSYIAGIPRQQTEDVPLFSENGTMDGVIASSRRPPNNSHQPPSPLPPFPPSSPSAPSSPLPFPSDISLSCKLPTPLRQTIPAINHNVRARRITRRVRREIQERTLQLVRQTLAAHGDLIFP